MPDHAYALRDDLQAQEVPLDQLFLDPNNPRFVGSGWQDVPEDRIVLESTQSDVLQRLLDDFDIHKLRANMEINGFLPIDRIVVRKLSDDAYVVLEGNRRVSAAKELRRVAARDSAIPDEISRTVSIIPCLLYTGEDPQAAWTFQGLRHITGIKDWPAFNKAKLLVTQMEKEGLALTEVGQRFGLTGHGAGQWVRGYRAFTQACEESDYTEELDERAYTYFQELFSRSSVAIREWMDWDSNKFRFRNALRFNEFVSWLYPRPADADSTKGEWENRRLPVRDSLRSLSLVYREDKEAFEEFRRGKITMDAAYVRVVSRQYERQADRQQEVFDAVSNCTNALENLPFKMLVDDILKARLTEGLDGLKGAIAAIESSFT